MFGRIGWIVLLSVLVVRAQEPLVFGAIATVAPQEVEKHFQPLFEYLEPRIGRKIVFETGPTYERTIEDFVTGHYDFGWIGPSPYVTARKTDPKALNILGALQSEQGATFEGVIVVRADSPMRELGDLAGKRFAFGSINSTLSYFVPKYMLNRAGVYSKLREKLFMGRHDKVLKQVIMGKADAGGVKASVAQSMKEYIRVIERSEPIPDFAIVCRASLEPELQRRIQAALLELKDPKVLNAIKKGSVGFIRRDPDAYDYLQQLMEEVEAIDRNKRN